MSCVQFEHHKLFAFRFLRARLPQTVVVHICRACIQMYSGIVISFGCHSEFTDAQKPFFGLCFYIVLAVMLYGCALAGAVHTAGTARLYLFRLLPNLAPACCSSSLSFLFKLITSCPWVSLPFAAVALHQMLKQDLHCFLSMICWIYEASCAKAVQTNCLPAG